MALSLLDHEQFAVGSHSFRAAELDPRSAWLRESAQEYRRLLTEFAPPLPASLLDSIDVVDSVPLQRFLEAHLIPPRRQGRFDSVRSDFGEVLAYMVLEGHYSTIIGLKSVRERELLNMASRGIDVVGIETQGKLRLVLGEVKVSDDEASPPEVVDRGPYCLREQLSDHLRNREATLSKLVQIARRSRSADFRDKLLTAITYWSVDAWERVEVVCCGLLVRSKDRYQQSDFGSFAQDQSGFDRACLRMIIVLTPESIDTTVRMWYELVSEGVAQ